MKNLRILGLSSAIAVLTAFAGTASATELTSPAGTKLGIGTVIKAAATHFERTGTISITCTQSDLEATITNAGGFVGGVTQRVEAKVTKLTFLNCGNHTHQVSSGGTLSIESIGSGKGIVRSTGMEVTSLTHSLFLGTRHCIYVTNNTNLGTITGGSPAVLTIPSVPIKQSATDSLCGEDQEWHSSYTLTSPNPLIID